MTWGNGSCTLVVVMSPVPHAHRGDVTCTFGVWPKRAKACYYRRGAAERASDWLEIIEIADLVRAQTPLRTARANIPALIPT